MSSLFVDQLFFHSSIVATTVPDSESLRCHIWDSLQRLQHQSRSSTQVQHLFPFFPVRSFTSGFYPSCRRSCSSFLVFGTLPMCCSGFHSLFTFSVNPSLGFELLSPSLLSLFSSKHKLCFASAPRAQLVKCGCSLPSQSPAPVRLLAHSLFHCGLRESSLTALPFTLVVAPVPPTHKAGSLVE